MTRSARFAVLLLPLALPLGASASDRYVEEGGVTYLERRRTVSRPVADTRYEDREQTVYRQKVSSEVRDARRTVYTPITEYQWRTVLRNRWNPFAVPYLDNELVPARRWKVHEEVVQMPVVRRELVPEKQTVKVPVTTWKMAEEEVVERVVVNPRPTVRGQQFATWWPGVRSPPRVVMPLPTTDPNGFGGVARLESDPPRASSAWRPARQTQLR